MATKDQPLFANIDARGGIRTVVRAGSRCASACSMALFMTGETRIVYMGGLLGLHFCYRTDGAPECDNKLTANATKHGLPFSVIEIYVVRTKPTDMFWLGAEDAECWGLMKWNAAANPSKEGL